MIIDGDGDRQNIALNVEETDRLTGVLRPGLFACLGRNPKNARLIRYSAVFCSLQKLLECMCFARYGVQEKISLISPAVSKPGAQLSIHSVSYTHLDVYKRQIIDISLNS